MTDKDLDYIEITSKEIEVLRLINIDNLDIKKCSLKTGMSIDELEKSIINTRKKVTLAIVENKSIKIVCDDKESENQISTVCKFRCAICGKIYTINYIKEEIKCPLCGSNSIMTNSEAGFIK